MSLCCSERGHRAPTKPGPSEAGQQVPSALEAYRAWSNGPDSPQPPPSAWICRRKQQREARSEIEAGLTLAGYELGAFDSFCVGGSLSFLQHD